MDLLNYILFHISRNFFDFGARMYDGRLGNWLSIDYQSGDYHTDSPYIAKACNPIIAIDPNGKEVTGTTKLNEETGKTTVNITLFGKMVFDDLLQNKGCLTVKDVT